MWVCTGDCASSARYIGQQVGIGETEILPDMMPNEKSQMVQNILTSKFHPSHSSARRVMMIGDGVNDAASLASATIGVAIGARARLTVASAHVLLMSSDLTDLLSFFDLSRITMKTIRLNFLWAFGFNLFSLPLAAGFLYPRLVLPPAVAGALMALSSIVVVSNSLLLLRFKPRPNSSSANSPLSHWYDFQKTELVRYSRLQSTTA